MTDNLLTPEIEASSENVRPELLPEKFWDAEKGQIRLDALISSYLSLEKKLSSGADTPEGRERMQRALGVPDCAEDYIVDVSHGLFQSDAGVNERLHALGFTPEQVQAVYDLAAEKLVPLIVEISDEFKAEQELQRLVSAFGGPDKWAETSRQLLAYARKNFPAEIVQNLASSYEGVMALHRMMKGGDLSGFDGQSAPAVTEGDLQSMMRDPKYWQKKDPAFVAKVTEGFRRIYG